MEAWTARLSEIEEQQQEIYKLVERTKTSTESLVNKYEEKLEDITVANCSVMTETVAEMMNDLDRNHKRMSSLNSEATANAAELKTLMNNHIFKMQNSNSYTKNATCVFIVAFAGASAGLITSLYIL